ncbi:hypothetical protein P0D87_16180 [Paraburkholderia sp. RL17-368-BIF-A]|uniref:hypothetical protein n=1 Tax=Paraburkholderia sp. RL17-368-BIF-A TaxID=3031628 RepID=UPI0038C60CCE
MTKPKTTADLARDSFGLPDTEPPTEFSDQPAPAPPTEDIDPELTDFAQSVDSQVREHDAGHATADAIKKAKGAK